MWILHRTDQINEIPHVPGQNEASLPGVVLAEISRRSSAKNLKGAGSGNSDQIPPGCLCVEVSGIPEEEIENVVDSHACVWWSTPIIISRHHIFASYTLYINIICFQYKRDFTYIQGKVGSTLVQNRLILLWLIGELFISGIRCESRICQHVCMRSHMWVCSSLQMVYENTCVWVSSGKEQIQIKMIHPLLNSSSPPLSQSAPPHLKINMSVLPSVFDFSGCFQFFVHFFFSVRHISSLFFHI